MPNDEPNVCVFTPTLFLTVMAERGPDENDELHFHPGGQGTWIARMLRQLGERPVIVAPLGGETGLVIRGLASAWKLELSAVTIEGGSPAYLHDRRSGERHLIARSPLPALGRHEIDDLYSRVLDRAAAAGASVVTGASGSLPLDFYRRLGADLDSIGVPVVADLHGAELDALLEGRCSSPGSFGRRCAFRSA